jgi:hypothetical protein
MISKQLTTFRPTPAHLLIGTCVILALTVLSLLSFAISTWQADWILTQQTAETPAIPTKASVASVIQNLPHEHLFGNAANPLGHMPISSLQFRVIGIAKAQEPERSKAYISIAGHSGKIFHIGDLLPYGVRVYDITEDTVILQNNGQLEKLPLPRESLTFKTKLSQEQL